MRPWWLSIEDEFDVFRLKSEQALDRPNDPKEGACKPNGTPGSPAN